LIELKNLDIGMIVVSLSDFADRIIQDQPKPIERSKLDQVFIKIIYDTHKGFKTNDDREIFLREQFECDNEKLIAILGKQVENVDMAQLR
jgi:hypothetical protein